MHQRAGVCRINFSKCSKRPEYTGESQSCFYKYEDWMERTPKFVAVFWRSWLSQPILAAILAAISNRPCKLVAILWEFSNRREIAAVSNCSNLVAISRRFLHGLPKRCLGGPLKGNLSRLSFLSLAPIHCLRSMRWISLQNCNQIAAKSP